MLRKKKQFPKWCKIIFSGQCSSFGQCVRTYGALYFDCTREFHDFAGSGVVHLSGGIVALGKFLSNEVKIDFPDDFSCEKQEINFFSEFYF